MDYEKLYNEVLGRAKIAYKDTDRHLKASLERIFKESSHELRESEDERIRKSLIAMLSQDKDLHSKEIAWLEKQGEQKPIEQDTETNDLWVYIREWNDKFGRLPKDEDELAACIDYVMKRQKPVDYDCYKIDEMVSEYQNNPEQGTEFGKPALCMVRAYRQGIENAIQKFGLQKPVEDGCKNSDDITTEEKDITEYKKGFECGKQYVLKYPRDYGLCKVSVKQNPAWSEEDEKIYQFILDDTVQENQLDNNQIAWLKSLKHRVQPQPKYQWTDEDEKNLRDLLVHGETKLGLRRWIAGLPEKMGSRSEYHWKPCEKQLEALRVASEVGTANNSWAMSVLKDLLEELKLLKDYD